MSDVTPLPSGTVTFMFTDIVGATGLKKKMPEATSGERQDAFREKVKAPHHTIITERVGVRGGCVVKGTGDGFLIAFSDPEKAVLCGVEIQQRIGDAAIFTPSGILQIRIGLNSGHADCIANDYIATAVDKAKRVESEAGPSQVYLSRETHGLVQGKVRGISMTSIGFHDLIDFEHEELFVAFPDGGSSVEPAPAAMPAKPAPSTTILNNLPCLQPFFGREDELKKIADALDPDSRTWGALIDGPGGMGKTSLAVRAAYDCPPGYFQRIIFVSVKDREMDDDGQRSFGNILVPGFLAMLNELARELGQPDLAKAAESDRIRLLLDALRGTKVLLILDNLESLSKPDRDTLFTFVKKLPAGCKAILTSRGRIGSGAEELILEKLSQEAALATLADIATHNPLLAQTSEAERLVLYRETAGKPLLLRWTAGQIGRGSCLTFTDALHYIRSCPEENDPLEFIFGDLVEDFSDAETKALCALTYFTLPAKVGHIAALAGVESDAAGDESDAAQMKRVARAPSHAVSGAPAGNIDAPGAAALPKSGAAREQMEVSSAGAPKTAGEGARATPSHADIDTALRSLVNRSLAVPSDEFQTFALVPMVADFLRNAKPAIVAETGARLEKRAYALIMENGWENHARFPALEAAWPGIAPALALFLAGDNARLQTVCAALQHFLEFQGRWDERLALSEKAEARAVSAADHDRAGWRAKDAGYIHYLRQQADAVLTCADRNAAHWDRAKAGARERAIAIRFRGIGHQLKGDYPAAITAYRDALDLDRSLAAESVDVAIDLNALAVAEQFSRDFAAAEGHYREALRVARAIGHAEIVGGQTGNLAALALDREDWPAAETLAREALPLSEAVHRQELIAANNGRLAKALVRQGAGRRGPAPRPARGGHLHPPRLARSCRGPGDAAGM